MVEVYLARHGETEENVAGILQGHLPGHLTENGKQQAIALRESLLKNGTQVDVLVVSDLKRTLDTANILNEAYHIPIIPCPLLRERDWGPYTGAHIGHLQLHPLPAGVESIEALFVRARNFLNYLQENFDGKRVLAIGHGMFNRCIQAALEQVTIQDIPKMQNAEVRKIIVARYIDDSTSDIQKGEDIISAN